MKAEAPQPETGRLEYGTIDTHYDKRIGAVLTSMTVYI